MAMDLDPSSDDVRIFRLSVDVRSFKAGLRLPMKAINAFVHVHLPPEIIKLAMTAGNTAKLTAPLRTHPPVMVQKGSEIALSNGYVSLELPAPVRGLAAALAQDPRLQAQVFHRDKYAADSLIGSASIPMAPLMKEPWLDGYAPVYSPNDNVEQDGQVSIGNLRVVLSAEELGPATRPFHKPFQRTIADVETISSVPSLEDSFLILKRNFNENLGSKVVGVQTESEEAHDEKPLKGPSNTKGGKFDTAHGSRVKKLKPIKGNEENVLKNPLASISPDSIPSALQPDDMLRKHELVREFERWRRAQEAKWRADLNEKEVKKMAALEAEWKQKEKYRILDIDKTRVELTNLETKFRAKLFALEKRERALVLAEEEASLRREAWTRECAQRAADAEVAVKRLQSECEHRVELERTKYTALKEQHAVLGKRLRTANEALAELEKQFCAYKTEHWKTSEAELLGQVMLLKQQYIDLQRRSELVIRAKNDYKTQVWKMAKELAKLHRQHAHDEANRRAQDRGQLALQSLIEAQERKNNEERFELRQLKDQLERLQMMEQTEVAAPTAAASATVAPVTQNTTEAQKADMNPSPSLLYPSLALRGSAKKFGSVGHGLDEATQVDLSMENAFLTDIRKHGISFTRQETYGLDNWLAEELIADDVLNQQSNIPLCEVGHKQESVAYQTRTKSYLADTMRSNSDENKVIDSLPYSLQLSEFQNSEIRRLTKQRGDLLHTGVYTEEDRIIKGIDQEIQRLQSVDIKKIFS